jgi:phosphoglycerate kinase
MAIVGGAKISTKLDLLKNLVSKVDYLVLGGGMANTFLAAQGISVGKSLKENNLFDAAKKIMELAPQHNCALILPTDALVSSSLTDQSIRTIPINQIEPEDCIFDVGPETLRHIEFAMQDCKTLLWNGPLGVFETPPYDTSSHRLAEIISLLTSKGLISVAGGGDTLSALHAAKCQDSLTYTSTAGGAFLEWLEGKELPGILALGEN